MVSTSTTTTPTPTATVTNILTVSATTTKSYASATITKLTTATASITTTAIASTGTSGATLSAFPAAGTTTSTGTVTSTSTATHATASAAFNDTSLHSGIVNSQPGVASPGTVYSIIGAAGALSAIGCCCFGAALCRRRRKKKLPFMWIGTHDTSTEKDDDVSTGDVSSSGGGDAADAPPIPKPRSTGAGFGIGFVTDGEGKTRGGARRKSLLLSLPSITLRGRRVSLASVSPGVLPVLPIGPSGNPLLRKILPLLQQSNLQPRGSDMGAGANTAGGGHALPLHSAASSPSSPLTPPPASVPTDHPIIVVPPSHSPPPPERTDLRPLAPPTPLLSSAAYQHQHPAATAPSPSSSWFGSEGGSSSSAFSKLGTWFSAADTPAADATAGRRRSSNLGTSSAQSPHVATGTPLLPSGPGAPSSLFDWMESLPGQAGAASHPASADGISARTGGPTTGRRGDLASSSSASRTARLGLAEEGGRPRGESSSR